MRYERDSEGNKIYYMACGGEPRDSTKGYRGIDCGHKHKSIIRALECADKLNIYHYGWWNCWVFIDVDGRTHEICKVKYDFDRKNYTLNHDIESHH